MENELINFSGVTIGYGKKEIAKELSFSIFENDFIGLVGPNGAGKTTLLKTLLGTIKPLSGKLKRNDIKFGYVPQRDLVQPLLPYSVFDVVMMGRYSTMNIFSKPGKADIKIVEESLSKVGILDLLKYNYNSLSGGQRQRTLIARALAVKPDVLILDEPTNGMDTPSHYSLLKLVSDLHSEQNLTIIMVSHLLSDVANSVKKLMLIDKGYFHFGDVDDILSEENLRKAYTTSFSVTKVNDEYLITAKGKH